MLSIRRQIRIFTLSLNFPAFTFAAVFPLGRVFAGIGLVGARGRLACRLVSLVGRPGSLWTILLWVIGWLAGACYRSGMRCCVVGGKV